MLKSCILGLFLALAVSAITDEEIDDICANIPTLDELAKFEDFIELSGCPKGGKNKSPCNANSNSEGNAMCQSCRIDEDDEAELGVLTKFIRCFRDSCLLEEPDRKDGVRKCTDRMQLAMQNIFQFTPPNYEGQIKRACDCSYSSTEDTQLSDVDGGVKVCEMRHVFNCQAHEQYCLNTADITYQQTDGCTNLTDDAIERVRERIEWGRIQKYCEVDMKNMLDNEGIGNYKCKEAKEYKAALLSGCSAQCYYKMRHISFDTSSYQDTYDYYFDTDCEMFDYDYLEDYDLEDNFWSMTVFYRGNKEVWNSVVDVCHQYRESGDLLQPARKTSPFPRIFWTEEEYFSQLDTCCDDLEYYESLDKSADLSLHGRAETECLKDAGYLLDYGFSMNLLRSLLRKKTGQCWENALLKDTCTPNPDWNEPDCTSAPEQMSLTDNNKVSPKNIFWFLRYLDDTREKAWALKGCARGARLGKTQHVYPGLGLSLEGQSIATNVDASLSVPSGYKTIYFLAFQACGVISSMEANNYFEEDYACNPYQLDPEAKQDSCINAP